MPSNKLITARLFKKIAEEGCRSAYNEFFDIYYPKFIKFAILFVKQHHFAEEVVSEALIKIFKNRQKISRIDNIEGYLFITVKNECIRYLERNRKYIGFESIENEEDFVLKVTKNPEDEVIYNEFSKMIKETIKNLPPKRKMIYRLIREDGLKYKDVATLLNISPKTVDAHMGLALKSLNKAIRSYKEGKFRITSMRKISN
ncbi:MAG: RNA polymerase sigma-70 factor [Cytophagales bacterium]|nr:RNA polymerase sigma-70 factor [Cytophagales bacterium]